MEYVIGGIVLLVVGLIAYAAYRSKRERDAANGTGTRIFDVNNHEQ